MNVSAGILDFLYVRWPKNLELVESLVMVIRTRSFFIISNYSDYMMLLGKWLLSHDCTRTNFVFAWSRDWTTLLPLKLSLASIFNSVDFWSSMSCIVLDCELSKKNGKCYKRVGSFYWRECSVILFSSSKKYKPTGESFWGTKNLYWTVWDSRSLD